MRALVLRFFHTLFSEEVASRPPFPLLGGFPPVSLEVWNGMTLEVTDLEVTRALFHIGAHKAPGPYGFHAHFFQSQWSLVKPNVCRPKLSGGLGLKHLGAMNAAAHMKLGWSMLQEPTKLCNQVFRAKYKVDQLLPPALHIPSVASPLWRSICATFPMLLAGAKWTVRFWLDHWIPGVTGALISYYIRPVPAGHLARSVRDYVDAQGYWAWDDLRDFLPHQFLLHVAAVFPPRTSRAADQLYWSLEPSGHFSTRSAYRLLSRHEWEPRSPVWQLIWTWQGPKRVQMHLWLVAKQRLMTNGRRFQLSLADFPACVDCPLHEESLAYVFRDCWRARSIWNQLLHGNDRQQFYRRDFPSWLERNLRGPCGSYTADHWPLVFGVVLWKLWIWRNERCFTPGASHNHLIGEIFSLVRDALLARQLLRDVSPPSARPRRLLEVSWSKPSEGLVNLSTDGSAKGNPGLATAGGLLRDAGGRWLVGFGALLEHCSALQAEFWAVYHGLTLAWFHGYSRVDLTIDSALVVSSLTSATQRDVLPLHSAIRELLTRN
ncbi:hypothetical protein K2173_010904 [Erythroxylum novogranatense]|uniref:RNase H type-1 domain-containing protein n=1 Tax=Erythroxylum novogranatense TaxID=1862640 RepID=A0AAV8T0H7_9ROSI|nr:hypothetical protein K2173_010904 [Erythroxylum novogranatense]